MGGDTEPQEMFSVLSLWYKESLMHDAIVYLCQYMSIEKGKNLHTGYENCSICGNCALYE